MTDSQTTNPHPLAGDPIELQTFGPLPECGTKQDAEKPRMDLIDPRALDELARVLTFGAKKYAAHNWRKGLPLSRLIAACMRHLNAINAGENLDSETGLHHAAHLMCEAMFLLWMIENRKDLDDRWGPAQ